MYTHTHNGHTDTHICISAGDVGGLVAPAAAACRGGDDDDTRLKHFSPDLYRYTYYLFILLYAHATQQPGLLSIHNTQSRLC